MREFFWVIQRSTRLFVHPHGGFGCNGLPYRHISRRSLESFNCLVCGRNGRSDDMVGPESAASWQPLDGFLPVASSQQVVGDGLFSPVRRNEFSVQRLRGTDRGARASFGVDSTLCATFAFLILFTMRGWRLGSVRLVIPTAMRRVLQDGPGAGSTSMSQAGYLAIVR